MAEEMKGPKKGPTSRKAPVSGAAEQSKLKEACKYIAKGVKAGVLSAFLAGQAMSAMGCGARTDLQTDEMATVDKDDDGGNTGAGGHDAGISVDAGGSKDTDAGGSKGVGFDAGGSKDTDAGGSKETDDAGSKPGPDGSMAG